MCRKWLGGGPEGRGSFLKVGWDVEERWGGEEGWDGEEGGLAEGGGSSPPIRPKFVVQRHLCTTANFIETTFILHPHPTYNTY